MPIGVPRILYMWGEDLPAQWTDIYNFIFRRRMVFLMQYLDDELCNQVCGLLINIHMEDRSKELESKEIVATQKASQKPETPRNMLQKRSAEDLLSAETDLEIDENYKLEQYTLQKITLEWLNWNAQFFDYNNQSSNTNNDPYLFYLADILSKDFDKTSGQSFYQNNSTNSQNELSRLMRILRNQSQEGSNESFNVYSPFRSIINQQSQLSNSTKTNWMENIAFNALKDSKMNSIYNEAAKQEFFTRLQNHQTKTESIEKALGQRNLKREYKKDRLYRNILTSQAKFQPLSYLDVDSSGKNYAEFREYQRKQTEQLLREEEAKKVFVMINSVGGSVGNGITVHDALQFIKAGSLTLALGMAASAASLALAGGTIGERYVTEGCHVMLHQPEGGVSGQASDIWIDAGEIQKIRLDVAEIYSLTTYRPRHKILKDLDRDLYLTASETVQYGLADEIATNEVMHEIIEMTNKVWDVDDAKQQRLLETRSGTRDNTMNVEN
jgi:ATP-dependent Clp protease protease subunit